MKLPAAVTARTGTRYVTEAHMPYCTLEGCSNRVTDEDLGFCEACLHDLKNPPQLTEGLFKVWGTVPAGTVIDLYDDVVKVDEATTLYVRVT